MPPVISPQLAYSLLTGPSTLSALGTYAIRLAGGAVGGVIPFEISSDGRISIEAQGANPRVGNYHVINAYNIPMDSEVVNGVANVNLAQIGATNVPANPNVNNKLFVTGQLTGCSFVIQPDGAGGLNLAHIQPDGGRGTPGAGALASAGTSLELDIQNTGCFQGQANNDGMIVIGGRSYQHTGNGSVLGVHKADGWHVYFQINAGYDVISATEVYAP